MIAELKARAGPRGWLVHVAILAVLLITVIDNANTLRTVLI